MKEEELLKPLKMVTGRYSLEANEESSQLALHVPFQDNHSSVKVGRAA